MNRAATMRHLGADVPPLKKRLTSAFRSMRKRGLLALQYTKCCSTCANAQIRQLLEERGDKGKVYDGYVHFHTQDAEAFRRIKEVTRPFTAIDAWKASETSNAKLKSAWQHTILHLRFGSTESFNESADNDAVAVAEIVRACLTQHGIDSEWDGDDMKCIGIPLLQDDIERPRGC